MRVLVLDVEAGADFVGDYACTVAIGWGWGGPGELGREEKAHAVGPAEVEVFSDQLREEVAALHRTVKHLGETHLELPDRQTMAVARGAVSRRERPGEAV